MFPNVDRDVILFKDIVIDPGNVFANLDITERNVINAFPCLVVSMVIVLSVLNVYVEKVGMEFSVLNVSVISFQCSIYSKLTLQNIWLVKIKNGTCCNLIT